MLIHTMGLNIEHDDAFFIERPKGSGDNLFLMFKTKAKVWCDDKWVYVYPGSTIVYKKGSAQNYGADNMPYTDSYIHFDSEGEEYFERIGLNTDRPMYLKNPEEIEAILRMLSREQISESEYRQENEKLLLKLLFRKIAENQCADLIPNNDKLHLEELTALRSEMYSTPGKYKNIQDLTKAANLSLSYLQALYKEYFNTSCYEDLLNAKINGGKELLLQGDLTVKDIAYICGYENDTCFMRIFKSRTGMTPTEFRKMQIVNNI